MSRNNARMVKNFHLKTRRRFVEPHSRRFSVVVSHEPAHSLTALKRPVAASVRSPREQQDVPLPLMIWLGTVTLDIFVKGPSQRAFANEDHLAKDSSFADLTQRSA